MCFSAGASFTAGVMLTVIGTETLRKVHKPSQVVFASIPVFFAFQQFTEGILWLAIGKPGFAGLETVTTYIFLIMAQIIWPIMIPLSVLLLEDNRKRKKILFALFGVGITIGLYYTYRLIFYNIHASISGNHLAYHGTDSDPMIMVGIAFYLTATLAPLFVSSLKRTYILGVIMGISFIVSAVFYRYCLTSVWCFFAAVISFVVLYIIRDAHAKKLRLDKLSLSKIIAPLMHKP